MALVALIWALSLPLQAVPAPCAPETGSHDLTHATHADMGHGQQQHATSGDDHCDHGDDCHCPPVCHVQAALTFAPPSLPALGLVAAAHPPATGPRAPAHRWPLLRPPSAPLS